eukprot:scaffold23194_cov54-Attheya_sp.AAC.6
MYLGIQKSQTRIHENHESTKIIVLTGSYRYLHKREQSIPVDCTHLNWPASLLFQDWFYANGYVLTGYDETKEDDHEVCDLVFSLAGGEECFNSVIIRQPSAGGDRCWKQSAYVES